MGNDSTHFHCFFITVAFFLESVSCEAGAKKGRKGREKQERESEREKKGKGAVLFPSLPNPLFLFPRTVHLLLLYNLRNLREGSFEDGEGVRH